MDLSPETIHNAALQLPEAERLQLAVELLDSLPEDESLLSLDDSDLIAELEARGTDEEGSMTWEQLRDEGE